MVSMGGKEVRISLLRPEEVLERLRECPVVFIPVGPLEWHGPHLPLGTDALNAEHVSTEVCRAFGGLLWPTLFWGTERERDPSCLESLGFPPDSYIVGMDFPCNTLPSAYCHEEIFAVIIRETLRLVERIGARTAVIINGHGAVNHNQVLKRLEKEFNSRAGIRVAVRLAFPRQAIAAGSIGHATSDETSLMMRYEPSTVDLSKLPPAGVPFKYADFAVVDSEGFDGRGNPEKTVMDDPRLKSSAAEGARIFQEIVSEIVEEMKGIFNEKER